MNRDPDAPPTPDEAEDARAHADDDALDETPDGALPKQATRKKQAPFSPVPRNASRVPSRPSCWCRGTC